MKRIALLTIAMLFVAIAANAQIKVSDSEDTKLYITLNTVGTMQTLDQKNVFDTKGAKLPDLTSGMQTAFGDLGFLGKFGKNQEIEMYFDLYLASRNHPSTTYGDQGYLILHGVPENLESLKFLKPILSKVDFKAGAFLIDYGDQLEHRSNNAIVQKNPLVGNFVIDPNLVSIGGEIMSKPGARYGWLAGVTNGTNTEDYSVGRGIAYNGKAWFYPMKPLRVSGSIFNVNHSDSATSTATLFSGNRSGERYGAVLGGGQAPGDILPGKGKRLLAYQGDVTFDSAALPLKLYGHYGMTEDRDTNGPAVGRPEECWKYYAAEAKFNLSSTLYAAARYSGAQAMKLNNIDSNGKVGRIQIGGGLWLTKNMLVKAEWVDQKYRGFATGDVVNNGVAAWRNPEFKGIVSEVSFAF